MALPTNLKHLQPILHALHELGLLFMIDSKKGGHLQIVLNTSKLTNTVHELLFSATAMELLKEKYKSEPGFDIGIIPKKLLVQVLPEYITPECLIQLQYCQEISHSEINAFTSLTESVSTDDQTFLFFPALITSSKRRISSLMGSTSLNTLTA